MKFTATILNILLFSTLACAQERMLLLDHSCKNKFPVSTSISTIDNRAENQILGYIETGLNNRITEIKYNGNLADSIGLFFRNIPDHPEILLMLNEFNLWEYKDSDGEFGRFKLSIRFFKPIDNNKYVEFMTYDSLHSEHGMDVTNKLLRSVSKNLCEIASLTENTAKKAADLTSKPVYSLSELKVLDSLEKRHIPIYQDVQIKSGIYTKYENFKNNTPSEPIELFVDSENPEQIKIYRITEKGKKKRILSQNIYAVSDGSRVYKSLSMGFFEIAKENNDFYYIRPSTKSAGSMYLPLGSFGLVGGAIGGAVYGLANSYGSRSRGQLLLYKINHRRGNAIPLSKVVN